MIRPLKVVHRNRVPGLRAAGWVAVVAALLSGSEARAGSLETDPPPEVDAGDPLFRAGYLDVTLFDGVDPSGATDSTAGLQRAVDRAIEYTLAAYFPPGTYLVSDTLRAEQHMRSSTNTCGDKERSVVMVGSTSGASRPLIRLAGGSSGFGDPSQPRPVVHVLLPNPDSGERPACAFAQVFRGIDIAVGPGNPGAIGIRFDAAQESAFEDVRIDATGGYAGVTAIPGRGMATVNVEVQGGRFGFDLQGTGLGGSLVGVTLRGQTESAIRSGVWRGMSVTGFVIEKDAGPAIETVAGNVQSGNLVLTDGAIDLANPGTAIDNSGGVYLHLRNVYVRGADTVVESKGREPVAAASGEWTRVDQYSYCPTEARTGEESWNAIDGVRNRDELVSLASSAEPPEDLLMRHVPVGIASFEDGDVIDATDFGADGTDKADDTDAIRAALEAGDRVFLPRGEYYVSGTLELGAQTQLFGVPGLRTRIYPLAGWSPNAPTWMVETVDDPEARTVLSDVSLNPPSDAGSLGAVHWRAGRRSIVRSVARAYTAQTDATSERQVVRIDGGGGGRWYRWESIEASGLDGGDPHPESRKLMVSGTSEPLSFYGFNPEHGHLPMVELRDAANVRIFGTKSEGGGTVVLTIRDSHNIWVAMLAGNPTSGGTSPFVDIIGGSDIEVSGMVRPGVDEPLLTDEPDSGSGASIAADEYAALFARGALDHGAWDPPADVEPPGGLPAPPSVDVDVAANGGDSASPGDPDDPGDGASDPATWSGGCSVPADEGSASDLPMILVLLLVVGRRGEQPWWRQRRRR